MELPPEIGELKTYGEASGAPPPQLATAPEPEGPPMPLAEAQATMAKVRQL